MKYGEQYPTMCPPENAVAVKGGFYRLCDSETPSEKDFLTHFDLKIIPKGKECEARALSFFNTSAAAKRLTRVVKKFKNKIPVLIEVTPSHGIGIIDKNHLNLWEFKDISFIDSEIEQMGGDENGEHKI